MAIAIEMPKMSDTMEEGVLVAWLANEGDAVSAGDVIAQVETDKATMDLEVYDDGVLLAKTIEEGAAVPIGALIAVLGKEGEDVSEVLAKYGQGDDGAAKASEATPSETDDAPDDAGQPKATPAKQPSTSPASGDGAEGAVPGYGTPGASGSPVQETTPGQESSASASASTSTASGDDSRVKASPLARKMAEGQGLDLSQIQGTGPDGRIVKRDVEAAAQGGQAKPAAPVQPAAQPVQPARPVQPAAQPTPQRAPQTVPADAYEEVRISQMRKTIARRLAESKFTAPHFYLTVDVAMEEAIAFRTHLNELGAKQDKAKVSYNDLVTKACATALRSHPMVNASYLEAEGVIRKHTEVHVAVAVAVDEGLLTPVVRHADRKGLAQIASDTRELAGRARDKKLEPSDWEGSTFTTSNLGMFGIEEFTAIINPPNACILAIGGIRDVPVVRDGEVVPGKMMKLSLSCDHRVVDGASGAAFLTDVKGYLEQPMTMLL